MKFGFYVSGNAQRFRKLIESNKVNDSISFVLIDNIDNKVLCDLCAFYHIPFYEYSYKSLNLKGKERNVFISDKLLELMVIYKTTHVFVFASKILVGDLLLQYPYGLINFHPALLPAFPGINAIDQALENGALLLGNTAHFINEKMDDGAIIMQNLFPARVFTNYDEVLDKQIIMVIQLMKWIKEERLIINGKKVTIKDAVYKVDEYIPSLDVIL